jgi:hypothetical protein
MEFSMGILRYMGKIEMTWLCGPGPGHEED